LTIGKSISIQGHGFAGLSVPSGSGITINAAATAKVNLRGLLLDGVGTGLNGIVFIAGASLDIQDCLIRNFTNEGISFSSSAASTLSVSNTVASDNGSVGIAITPSPEGPIAVIDHVATINNGGVGISVTGNFTAGTIQVTVSDSVSANNAFGIVAVSTNGPTAVMVRNST